MKMSATPAVKLAEGLAAMGLELRANVPCRLLSYIALIAQWSRAYNLTAVRDPMEMVTRHVLDSLAIVPHLWGTTVVDLGSGAGLPGIPLAVARPGLQVTLIESNGKKARFLREAVRSLALANVSVDERRVQDASGSFDTVTARAFASLGDMLRWGGHLLAADGHWLAMKGRIDPAEVADVPKGFQLLAVRSLVVPGLTGDRHLLELARTPPRTP